MKSAAIYGFSKSTRDQINQSSATELWALNNAYAYDVPMERITRWYELHLPWQISNSEAERAREQFLREEHPFPIYMQKANPEYPASVKYPLAEICASVFGESRPYLTNTIAYMIAHAIHDGYNRIELYGVDMATGTEYAYQKAGTEHLIGIARGRGIDVYIPPESCLLNSPLYAYDGYTEICSIEIVKQHADHYAKFFDKLYSIYTQLSKRFEFGESAARMRLQEMNTTIWTYDGAASYLEALIKSLENKQGVSRQFLEREKTRIVERISNETSAMSNAAGYVTALQKYNILADEEDQTIETYERHNRSVHFNGGAVQAVNKLLKEIDLLPYDMELGATLKDKVDNE